MDGSKASPLKEMPLGIDATTEEEYASQSRLLQEFTSISSIDKAWIKSGSGTIDIYILIYVYMILLSNIKPSTHF